MSGDTIFSEIDKVIACQLGMESISNQRPETMIGTVFTKVPLVDIIVNIDLFTASFEDKNKVLTIMKELYNHCNSMKRLLMKHDRLVLCNLMDKYDKKCVQQCKAVPDAQVENRDEFLAVVIGQLLRLFCKSKSLSQGYTHFDLLEKLIALMQHEQYII